MIQDSLPTHCIPVMLCCEITLRRGRKSPNDMKASTTLAVPFLITSSVFRNCSGGSLLNMASEYSIQTPSFFEEIKTLKRRWRDAGDEKRAALGEIRTEMRKRLIQLRRAETIREKQREKRRMRKAFFNNPFQSTADQLGKPKGGTLSCAKEEIENSVAAAHRDSSRCIPLGECSFQLPIRTPHTPFNMADFTMDEVRAVVKKAQAGSAPGPSGTTYKIYKCCPLLLKRLSKLLQTLWKKKLEPGLWTLAEGCFVPKELNSTRLEQFREISLLDVEGKIFWSIFAKRLTAYLLANEFIDPSVQKGEVPGYSSCLEHTAVISQLINDAKSNNNTLSVVWLDLAKAYPSVPHQLILKALDHYRVPSEIVELVMAHMDALQMRFTVGSVTTKWQRLEKGIMTGCTISVALFIVHITKRVSFNPYKDIYYCQPLKI